MHGARAIAAAIAEALAGADVDTAVNAALDQLPDGTEIAPQRRPRGAAGPGVRGRGGGRLRTRPRAGAPDRGPRLQLRDRRRRDRAGRPRPDDRRPGRVHPGRARGGLPVPGRRLGARAGRRPDRGAGRGGDRARGLAGGLPDAGRAARCPGSPVRISSNSPGCWQPRNRPPRVDNPDMAHKTSAPLEAGTTTTTLTLDERITGALVGAAVGDALGGPVEGWTPEQIVERHGGRVTGIVGPWYGDDWRTARPIAPYHKGDGHVTDDTLMTHALVRVYETRARPPRRVLRRRPPRPGPDVAAPLDPGAGGRGAAPAADLPRREVDRHPAALRARRPPRGGLGEHRQLRRGDVHGPGRPGQRGPPGGRVRGGAGCRGRPPVLVRPGGGRGLRRRRRGRVRAGRDARLGRRDRSGAWRRTAPASAIEAVCEVAAAATTDFESALAPLREAVAPFDTVGPRLPRPLARRPAPLPAALHRGTPGRARHAARRRRRLPALGARLGQLRPGLRLDRHDERRARGRAPRRAARSPRPGRRRSPRPAASTCTPRRARWRRWPGRSSPGTPRGAARTRRRSPRWTGDGR